MHYEILDKKRIDILTCLKAFKDDFYMAGGTALALQLGHRDSVDFDFFSQSEFDTVELFSRLKKEFLGHRVIKIQEEKNTLTVLVDDDIKISFFTYEYKLLKSKTKEDNFYLASIEDIACMKLSAILSRASNKDYIDLYFIMQKVSLDILLIMAHKKYPDIDSNLILKSLVFFEDIDIEPITFKNNMAVSFDTVESFLVKVAKERGPS